jgi:hypothetical protein
MAPLKVESRLAGFLQKIALQTPSGGTDDGFCRLVLMVIRKRGPDMRVYYMTSMRWAEVILRERRLKLSRFYESNDPFELRLIDKRTRDTRPFAQLITNYFDKNVGMICFGASWASPVMWAHYAEKHSGMCLGFDVEDQLLTKIEYTDGRIQVPFGAHLAKFGLSANLLTKIRKTKATDWSYEREYRVEAPLTIPDPHTGYYYTDFEPQLQLREVVLGHRCIWPIEKTISMLSSVTRTVRICKARPAFGKFEMVEQRAVRAVTVRPPIPGKRENSQSTARVKS